MQCWTFRVVTLVWRRRRMISSQLLVDTAEIRWCLNTERFTMFTEIRRRLLIYHDVLGFWGILWVSKNFNVSLIRWNGAHNKVIIYCKKIKNKSWNHKRNKLLNIENTHNVFFPFIRQQYESQYLKRSSPGSCAGYKCSRGLIDGTIRWQICGGHNWYKRGGTASCDWIWNWPGNPRDRAKSRSVYHRIHYWWIAPRILTTHIKPCKDISPSTIVFCQRVLPCFYNCGGRHMARSGSSYLWRLPLPCFSNHFLEKKEIYALGISQEKIAVWKAQLFVKTSILHGVKTFRNKFYFQQILTICTTCLAPTHTSLHLPW